MSFCPIEDAFQDPFLERIKRNRKRNNRGNNNNVNKNINNINNVIENFECLNGQGQLDISDEYKYKNMLSRRHPEEVNVDVNLNQSTQELKRPDEQNYYPDMSLENEYALITDVRQNQGQAYRPPHPFQKESNPFDARQSHPQMLESFNESDNLMAIDSESVRSQLMSPHELVSANNNNQMVYKGDSNTSESSTPNSNLTELLENQKELEFKLDKVLNRLERLESEGDGKENIHDIILFGIFGIFFMYMLDSVYKIGKKNL